MSHPSLEEPSWTLSARVLSSSRRPYRKHSIAHLRPANPFNLDGVVRLGAEVSLTAVTTEAALAGCRGFPVFPRGVWESSMGVTTAVLHF